jgi:hypothetical protein
MTVDLSNITAADLKAALAKLRADEKAKQDSAKQLPRFAFVLMKTDSSLVYWAGQAVDYDTAREIALCSVQGVFYGPQGVAAIMDRPLPNPKGRKPGSTLSKAVDVVTSNAE